MPILANYYVTYRCNAKCGFCDIWEKPSPMIDLKDAERNLDDLKRLGVKIVDFTGGEPLLHTRLHELLRMAKDRGLRTTVTTNGLLYPKRAEQLKGLVDLLHFSIDAPYPKAHNASRGVDCFARLMKSIEVALSLGERPDLLFTVTNASYPYLETIYERFSHPNGLTLIVNPVFEYEGLGEMLREEVMQKMEAFARQPYVYLNPAFLALRRKGGNAPEAPVCKAVSTTVVISPFNEVVLPCYHFGLEKLPIGEEGLYALWQSEKVAWHRQMQGRHDICRGCTVNCYFEPSFATSPLTPYFWQSLPSKARYAWTKFVLQRLDARRGPREASLPDLDTLVAEEEALEAAALDAAAQAAAGDGAGAMIDLPVLDR